MQHHPVDMSDSNIRSRCSNELCTVCNDEQNHPIIRATAAGMVLKIGRRSLSYLNSESVTSNVSIALFLLASST